MDAASDVRIAATLETPNENRSDPFLSEAVSAREKTLWVPAADVILRVTGTYPDGAECALSWHLTLKPGYRLNAKRIVLTAPPSRDILDHPGMAYIPPAAWIHGEDYQPRQNRHPFWIDIRPPTVREYVPIAERLLDRGLLQQDNSFVLTARQQSSAIDATGLGQLRSLNNNLGEIFGVIAQGTSTDVSAPGDIVAGDATLPVR